MSSIANRTGVIRNGGYGSAARPVQPQSRSSGQEMGAGSRMTPQQAEAYRQQYAATNAYRPGGYLGQIQLPRYDNPEDMVSWLQKSMASGATQNPRMQQFLSQQLQQAQRQVPNSRRSYLNALGLTSPEAQANPRMALQDYYLRNQPGSQPTQQPGGASPPRQQGIAEGEPNPSAPSVQSNALVPPAPPTAQQQNISSRNDRYRQWQDSRNQQASNYDAARAFGIPTSGDMTFLNNMSPEQRNREGQFFDQLGLFNVSRDAEGNVSGINARGLDQLRGQKGFTDAGSGGGTPFQNMLNRAISQNAQSLPFQVNGQPMGGNWSNVISNTMTGSGNPGAINANELMTGGAQAYADRMVGMLPEYGGMQTIGGGAPNSTASSAWFAQNPNAAQTQGVSQIGYERGLTSPEYRQARSEYLNNAPISRSVQPMQAIEQARQQRMGQTSAPQPQIQPAGQSPTQQPRPVDAQYFGGGGQPRTVDAQYFGGGQQQGPFTSALGRSPSQVGTPGAMMPGAMSSGQQMPGMQAGIGGAPSPSQIGPQPQAGGSAMQRPIGGTRPMGPSQTAGGSAMPSPSQIGSIGGRPIGGTRPQVGMGGGIPGAPQMGGGMMPQMPQTAGGAGGRPIGGTRPFGPGAGQMPQFSMPQVPQGMPGNTAPGMRLRAGTRLPYQF